MTLKYIDKVQKSSYIYNPINFLSYPMWDITLLDTLYWEQNVRLPLMKMDIGRDSKHNRYDLRGPMYYLNGSLLSVP